MAFPVQRIRPSKLLAGQSNGKLSKSILTAVPGQAGGATVTLIDPAARAWKAMAAAALADGHVLKVASADRSYRPYSSQEAIFRARYKPVKVWRPGAKRWQGQWWVKKSASYANAAVPGTSNHGLGRAVDGGEESDGDHGTESWDTVTFRWLLVNAHSFGWCWEDQTERWHIVYFAGDDIPDRVKAYEQAQAAPVYDGAELSEDDDMQYVADSGDVWLIGNGWHRDVSEANLPAGVTATPIGGLSYILADMEAAGVSVNITNARLGG